MFWKDFFISSEKYFLPTEDKTYFVFTDATEIYGQNNKNVKKIFQKHFSWPFSTLMRFEMFSTIKWQLNHCHYLFSINASSLFVDQISAHVLPSGTDDGLVATVHPAFWKTDVKYVGYERNSMSRACIEQGKGTHYFMAAFHGGESYTYLKMVHTLKAKIDEDLSNGFIASWNDESHLNHYLIDKYPRILHPGYCYPEGWTIPFKPKLIILNKLKYGGYEYLRDTST